MQTMPTPPPMDAADFPARLNGWLDLPETPSKTELCEVLGMSRNTLWRWLGGHPIKPGQQAAKAYEAFRGEKLSSQIRNEISGLMGRLEKLEKISFSEG